MQQKKGAKHRFDRIAFLASETPEANAARTEFIARYGMIDPESAEQADLWHETGILGLSHE